MRWVRRLSTLANYRTLVRPALDTEHLTLQPIVSERQVGNGGPAHACAPASAGPVRSHRRKATLPARSLVALPGST